MYSDDESPKKPKKKHPKPIMTPYGLMFEDEDQDRNPPPVPEKTKEEIMLELPPKV